METAWLAAVESLLLPGLPSTGIVMDLACGNGAALDLLRRHRPGLRLLGYERDGDLLQQARARGLANATLARFDLTLDRPPPAAGRVDGALGSGVMDVLADPSSLLAHLGRLMRGGSPLLLHETHDVAARIPRWTAALKAAGFRVDVVAEQHVLAVSSESSGSIRGWE